MKKGKTNLNKYGEAALNARNLFTRGQANSPQDAWETATITIFGVATSGQKKGCPKETFLGLCEMGLINGISMGKYTRSKKNKNYAIRAVSFLKNDPAASSDGKTLWVKVAGSNKVHNSQMDVVIALWQQGFIN
jgi:hypothetical protein